MPAVLARTEVAAPAVQPYRYGLLSAAQVLPTDDVHMALGTIWIPNQCDRPGIAPDPCATPAVAKELAELPLAPDVVPFAVYGSFTCSLVGFTPEEAHERAVAHLTQGEQRAVEYAVWTGEQGTEPHLADSSTTTLAGASTPADAVATLEDWLATNYSGTGVLHMARGAATWLASDNLLRREGDRLETQLGTRVAAGGGYSEANTSPAGAAAAAGTYWIYATGAVVLRRSPIIEVGSGAQGFDVGTNNIIALAERYYSVGWECGAAAVLLSP
jgi:hypothetical protein